jgi:bifunctional non-homologous end joining protein LigD
MEPYPAKTPFDDPGFFFQIKWDGVRMLAFKEGQQVRLQNRRGHDRTAQYPELQQLTGLVNAREALLDGEVVVMEGGKPSFPRIIQRDFCRQERAIKALSRSLRCTYCLFDLLFLDGSDLTGRPLEERLQILENAVQPGWPLYLNENFQSGVALYRRVEALGLEGIVAKAKQSPYLPGQKSNHWMKVKPRRRLLCVVGGLKIKEGAVGALLLGAFRDGTLQYVGRAGSGLSRSDLLMLRQFADSNAVGSAPFAKPPGEKGCLWLQPRLTVIIEYAEWTPDLKLRAPVVIGFSNRSPKEAEI